MAVCLRVSESHQTKTIAGLAPHRARHALRAHKEAHTHVHTFMPTFVRKMPFCWLRGRPRVIPRLLGENTWFWHATRMHTFAHATARELGERGGGVDGGSGVEGGASGGSYVRFAAVRHHLKTRCASQCCPQEHRQQASTHKHTQQAHTTSAHTHTSPLPPLARQLLSFFNMAQMVFDEMQKRLDADIVKKVRYDVLYLAHQCTSQQSKPQHTAPSSQPLPAQHSTSTQNTIRHNHTHTLY